MTKVYWVVAIILVCFGGFKLWEVWDDYDKEKDIKAAEAAKREIKGELLEGLPWDLPNIKENLEAAEKNGPAALKNWLKTYGGVVKDPRKAWIEMDYMLMISKDDPAEAKKIFRMIQERVPTNSPVYPRIQQLRPTYGD